MTKQVGDAPSEVDSTQAVLEHIAYHEAGHAVVAALLGYHIEWAAIAPARGLQGGRVFSKRPAPTTTQAVIEEMTLSCAGLVAETLSPHQHLLRDESLNRIDDLLSITQAVTTFFPTASAEEQQQLWQAAHDYATDLLLEQPEHRAAIHSLAAVLLQQGEVSHEEVMALILQARDQEQSIRLSAQSARERRFWRWFLCRVAVLFAVELAALEVLTLFVNVWFLLGLTVVCSALLPWWLWKMALRRFGEDEPATETQDVTKQRRIWSLADYRVVPLERLGMAHSIKQKPAQKPAASQKKPPRALYDRHRRLPQRRKKSI